MNKNKRLRTLAIIPVSTHQQNSFNSNLQLIDGHAAIAYSISAALNSKVFSTVIVFTQSEEVADLARYYGAEAPAFDFVANRLSRDHWIKLIIKRLAMVGHHYDCYSILQPNFPFRQMATIQRAWRQFSTAEGVDFLQSVEKCSQHPEEMWVVKGNRLLPLLPYGSNVESSQFPGQYFPDVYIRSSCIQMAWTGNIMTDCQDGYNVMPFKLESQEGLELSQLSDIDLVKNMVVSGQAKLPKIITKPYKGILSAVPNSVTSH